jgi:hypothetical protein
MNARANEDTVDRRAGDDSAKDKQPTACDQEASKDAGAIERQ